MPADETLGRLKEFFIRVMNLSDATVSPVPMSEWPDPAYDTSFRGLIDSVLRKKFSKGGEISMNSDQWIALINAIIQSGLADKLVELIIALFNALTEDLQKQVANAAAKVALTKIGMA